MTNPITKFQGEHRWLSNFEKAPVIYEGITYPSTEHAYQALKSTNLVERQYVANSESPAQAKKRGMQIRLRPDWEQVKVDVMYKVNRDKFFRHERLKTLLLATGDVELVEGNDWGDQYWGVCEGIGQNKLGRILMSIRFCLL